MNHNESLAELLKVATGRSALPAQANEETRALHSTYREFAALLESTEEPVDESRLIAAILPPAQVARASESFWSHRLALLAVAASTLLLVALASLQFGANHNLPLAARNQDHKAADPTQEFVWDDDWDSQISSVESYAVSLQAPDLTPEESATWYLGEQVDRMQSEWNDDAVLHTID